ncbi:hypothetical protein, partial [Pseudomonas nitroreducens]
MDYVFRRLALDYLPFESRQAMGIYSAEERQRYLETGSYEPAEETGSAAELLAAPEVEQATPVVEDASPAVEEAGHGRLETPEVKDTAGSAQREVPATEAKVAHTSAELMEKITGTAVDSPLCFTCG